MKKIILIIGIIFLLIGVIVSSSTGYFTIVSNPSNIYHKMNSQTVLLFEDFSGSFPPDGWETDSWIQYNSSYNNLANPSACLYKYNQVNNDSAYITSKPVDASEYEGCLLNFNFGGDVQYTNYCYFYIKYRRNLTSPWVDITPWENPLPEDMAWNNYEIEIINMTEGCGEGLQINWTYTGYYFYYNYFWLDDVKITNGEHSNTLYVGGNGSGNYSKIQDAVDNASDGDTVFVYSGKYYENVIIDKSINLIGEDKNTTIIDYNNSNSERIIFIVSDNVSIRGFTIQNSIENGIEIEYYFGNCTISDNIIANNFFDGICMHRSNNNIIKDNNFYDNHAMFLSRCDNNIIAGNSINNSIFSYFPSSGIIIVNSKWNNISENIIEDNRDGILLLLSENNFIFNNIINSNDGYGIEIRDSSDNNIYGNNISYNYQPGIYIQESANNNFFYHNNFVYNAENAVDLGNNIWDNGDYGNYWNDYKLKYPLAMKNPIKPWIWNTPYEITGGSNIDNCPLVKPWPKSKSKSVTSYREDDCNCGDDISNNQEIIGKHRVLLDIIYSNSLSRYTDIICSYLFFKLAKVVLICGYLYELYYKFNDTNPAIAEIIEKAFNSYMSRIDKIHEIAERYGCDFVDPYYPLISKIKII